MKSITKMDHPPHSPDLVPCEFWLFQKLKYALKEQRFADIPDIQHNVTLMIFKTVSNSDTISQSV
jgi:hypothetical protein